MFRSYRAKLQTVFVLFGLVAIALTGWEASAAATAALESATSDRLTAIRQTRARQVERYFEDLGTHVKALSVDESVIEALDHFRAAWRATPAATPQQVRSLQAYHAQFGNAAADWFPRDGRTIALQHLFLAANPHRVGAKDRLLEAPGAYGQAHARFHPTFHRYQTAFGFYDIFLIDAADLRVLYTVFKEIDFGVGLTESPYRDSALAAIARRAIELKDEEDFVLRDYEPYVPSHNDPAAFVATPIWHAGSKVGVLALQVSIGEVNRVLTGEQRWREEGLGNTGQAYAVGPDNLRRSDMRLRIEDPERYYAELRRGGTPAKIVDQVRQHGTAILQLPVAPEAARARGGRPGTERGLDSRGVPVLRSHAPLRVRGLDWTLMAEIEQSEALAPVHELSLRILGIGTLIAGAFLIAAAWLARSVTRPVQALADGAARVGEGNFAHRLPVETTDEIGQLAASFNRMAETLERTTVSKRELEHLAGQLLTAQEDERRRIARELHDDITQRMAAVAIEAGQLERLPEAEAARRSQGLARIKEHMGRLSVDIHRMSRNLHPAILDDLGLVAAIEQECRGFFERGGPPVEFEHKGDLTALRPETQIVVYRLVQEALRNVEKHSQAESVQLRIDSNGGVRLRINDDGCGFDSQSLAWRRGLGLTSMEERVRQMGGKLTLRSQLGKGTEIEVWLP